MKKDSHKVAFICLLHLFLGSCTITSKLHYKINNVEHLEQIMQPLNKNTLVVFDIDDVLITPVHPLLQSQNKKVFSTAKKEIAERLGRVAMEQLDSIIIRENVSAPVEKEFTYFIKRLQEQGIKTIALSNSWAGRYGTIRNIEDIKIKTLQNAGYNFEVSWPNIGTMQFQIRNTKTSLIPLFKDGVIFTSGADKGDVLLAFLKEVGTSYKKIIFVDDKKENLAALQRAAERLNISYEGFEYSKIKDLSRDKVTLEEAKKILSSVEKNETWKN